MKHIIFFMALSFLTACSLTQSEDINTKAFYVSYDVRENSGQAFATTTLYVGDRPGGTFLKLTNGDYVSCNGQRLLEETNSFNQVQYKGSCGFVTANKKYILDLHVVSSNRDEIFSSAVELPVPIKINSPQSGDIFKRGAALQVLWNRDLDPVQINLQGEGLSSEFQGKSSIYSSHSHVNDPGNHIFSGADTNPKTITGEVSNVRIQVLRKRRGQMDTRLKGEVMGMSFSEVSGIRIIP